MLRRAGLSLLASLSAILPCLLIPSPQLGDLHTHLYNAWLSHQLSQPWASDCFYIVPAWTNTLNDRILSTALSNFGPSGAARAAAIAAVSTFFWGIVAWQRTRLGRWPLFAAPLLLALSYGWLLRAGFLNFMMGVGFAFACGAAFRPPIRLRAPLIAISAILGLLAHAIGFLMVIGLVVWEWLQSRYGAKAFWILPAASLLCLVGLRIALVQSGLGSDWFSVFGALGLTAFGGGGTLAALLPIAALVLFAALIVPRLGFQHPVVAAALLAVAAALLVPAEISMPGSPRPMSYNTVRIATLAWIFLFTALEAAAPPRWVKAPTSLMAAAFILLFVQEQTWLSHQHEAIQEAVLKLPHQSKVLLQTRQSGASVDGIVHMIDSACIGHCISLANYVPASQHFPLRRRDACPLSFSAARIADAENGNLIAQPGDMPLWRVYSTGVFTFDAAPMQAGERLPLQSLTR
jgi:hypothetical protein